MQIPDNIRDYLEYSDCSNFNEDSYYKTKHLDVILNEIKKTQRLSEKMKELDLYYANTTLLYGPPGTGKTTFAKYVAYKLKMPFIYINFSKIFDGILGQTSAIIHQIFDFAAENNCLLMIDEIDCISQKRGTESEATGGELSRITIAIMQALDSFKYKDTKTIIISATNRLDIMDPALKSRFSIVKEVKNLTIAEKEEYIQLFISAVNGRIEDTGKRMIELDENNLESYCSKSVNLSQRNIESDIIRCIAEWIDGGRRNPLIISHIDEKNRR